jgi:hypothetical protein
MNDIEEYLIANRERYTREALTGKLVAAGHDPAAVEAAWARIAGGDSPPPGWGTGGRATPSRAGAGTYLLIVLVVLAFGFVGLLGAAGISLARGYASSGGGTTTALTLVYGLAMLGGLLFSVRRLYRAASIAEAQGAIFTAVAVSFLVLIGISGACIATVSGFGGVGARP